jgi:hypothetical protein
MRQVAAHQQFFEPAGGPAFSANGRAVGLNHLLLAIGRAMSPPVVHMQSTFQPMRIIVVQPDLVSNIARAAEWGCETPQLLPLALHPSPTLKQDELGWRQRIIQGEILSDQNGRLYEKLGRHVRPVDQLASGPSGELIEMIPVERSHLRVISSPARVVEPSIEKPHPKTPVEQTASPVVPVQRSENRAESARHRKLFTDPGQWRVVTWGEFKAILAPQLAHPERLRDTYRLPCYVQVVETNRDVTIEELAEEFSTKDVRPKPLYFLTDEIAAKLELTSLLPPLPARPPGARKPNVLLAHQRVFHLLVANDPTVDVGSDRKQARNPEETTKSQASSSKTKVADSAAAVLKTSIPNSFVKDWEFKISREEALYDMNDRGLSSALRKFARSLRVLKQYSEFRKWRVLITGKNADDQLWSVRPPANMLSHTFVREWVKKTLDLGGYDSDSMLREWEIFWRRKGLL